LRAGLLAVAALVLANPARAQIGSERYSAIVLDSRTGNVLVQASPDEQRHPASLTKMMTLYMVFEALREGRLSLDSRVPFSEAAASRPPSKLGVPPGNSISLEAAILALVTRSANDVAAAVGERLGGSEERFAQMMTLRARALGMTRTTFRNASGLPDPDQVTTARDMATLGRRLIQDFPDRYHYFGMSHAQIAGQRIRNHNRMLDSYDGVDGIKTGYIRDSGFNIVTSASRGGQRIVGAVFGGSSWVERDAHMASLLDQGFNGLGIAVATREERPVLVRTASAAPVSRSAARAAPRSAARPQPNARSATRRQATQAASRSAAARPTAAALRSVSTTITRAQPTRAATTTAPGRSTAKPPARSSQARPAPTRTAATPAPTPTRGAGMIRTAELR
jgi:D-alanyl-D-alanine carboxypeptidase